MMVQTVETVETVEQRKTQLEEEGIKSYDPEILQSPVLFNRFIRTHRALKSSDGSVINLKKAILENLNNKIKLLNKLKFEYNAGASFSSGSVALNNPGAKDEEVSKLIVASNVVDEIKLDLEEMIIIKVIENEQERYVSRTRVITPSRKNRIPVAHRAMTSKSAPQSFGSGTRRVSGGGGGKGTRRIRWRRKRGGVSRKV
jgi:hypothetical protein